MACRGNLRPQGCVEDAMTAISSQPAAPPQRVARAPRILLVGHQLPVALLESALQRQHCPNYLCVDALDAADWLIEDGFDADIVIVHAGLFSSSAHAAQWRGRHSHLATLTLPAACDVEALETRLSLLLSASRSAAAWGPEFASGKIRPETATPRTSSASHLHKPASAVSANA
jgi:hypothetical protein